MKREIKIVIIHLTACISFLALPYLFFPHQQDSFNLKNPPTQRDFIGQLLLIIFFYLSYYIFIPKLYFTKKYFLFISIVVVCFLVVILVPSTLTRPDNFGFALSFHNKNVPPEPPENNDHFLHQPPPVEHHFPINNPQFFLFWIVLFFALNVRINNSRRILQEEKNNAEIAYLKAQINPHFLFNTLNSIYALSIEKSGKAPEAVTMLANMMRYVLYQSEKTFVPLENEINYITDYIELQKIRFGDAVEIFFKAEGTTQNKIAPLLLIPFVENAFKYGVNAEENSFINISIKTENDILEFNAFNKKVNRQIIEAESGLGIANTKQRLEMLYPAKHNLMIDDTTDAFIVELKLDLR